MGYLFEIRAGSIDEVEQELRSPTLRRETVAQNADLQWTELSVRQAWPDLQRLVADAVAVGEPLVASSEVAMYVATVVAVRTHWWGSIHHTSSGGVEFRSDMASVLGPVFGVEFVAGLVSRPLLGLSSDDHPLVGWATREELAAAVAQADAQDPAPPGLQPELLQTVVRCVRGGVQRDLDLITVYR